MLFLNFLKRNWLAVLIIIIWAISCNYKLVSEYDSSIKKKEDKVKTIEVENKKIDSSITKIKKEELEGIKKIDGMSTPKIKENIENRYPDIEVKKDEELICFPKPIVKQIAFDLYRYDNLKKIDSLKDKKISNLNGIISLKDGIISDKDKIINKMSRPKINGYLGVECINLQPNSISPYAGARFEYKRIAVVGKYYINNKGTYAVNVEYKLF